MRQNLRTDELDISDLTCASKHDKPGTAKLKNDKTLKEAGDFLQNNGFGVAVVAAYTGMEGNSQKDCLLAEARAMVVRDYLVKNF
jgi:outer membrane protein OmpA-like peptidoglycan-associated protein